MIKRMPSVKELVLLMSIISAPPPARPTKTLYIIRHGVTEMNVALAAKRWGSKGFKDQMLWDTVLTPEGQKQAADLNKAIKRMVLPGEIQTIVSSPLTRALQTAELAFEGWEGTPRVVCPLLRERLYLSSDVGVRRSTLTPRFPTWDLSELGTNDEPWWYVPGDEGYVEVSEQASR
jgi:glucosyl-3-phosphoglycerate phosphatase